MRGSSFPFAEPMRDRQFQAALGISPIALMAAAVPAITPRPTVEAVLDGALIHVREHHGVPGVGEASGDGQPDSPARAGHDRGRHERPAVNS